MDNKIKWSLVVVFFFLVIYFRESVSKELAVEAEKTLSQASQIEAKPLKLSKGEALYIRNCADCHGWDGQSNGSNVEYMNVQAPFLHSSEFINNKTESEFTDWVLNGPTSNIKVADHNGLKTDLVATEMLAYIRKLPTINWSQADVGQEIYDKLCVSCHGLYGRGDGVLAYQMPVHLPDLNASGYLNQYSDERLKLIIAKGKNTMPGAEDILNVHEIEAVITFVRLLSPGYEKYNRFCAGCHGVDGFPVKFAILNEENDMVNFDNEYLNSHTDKKLIQKILHMQDNDFTTMPHFAGYLKEDEVGKIYRYLSSLNAELL